MVELKKLQPLTIRHAGLLCSTMDHTINATEAESKQINFSRNDAIQAIVDT